MSGREFEYGRAQPDQVTTARLQEARLMVADICELDIASVPDSVGLITHLQGISDAISDIVIARGDVEADNNQRLSVVLKAGRASVTTYNILRCSDRSDPYLTRVFTAQPARDAGIPIGVQGASMGTAYVGAGTHLPINQIHLPTDEQLSALQAEEPSFWQEMMVHSLDRRDALLGKPGLAYPFDSRHFTGTAIQQYLSVLQELSTELLIVSDPEFTTPEGEPL